MCDSTFNFSGNNMTNVATVTVSAHPQTSPLTDPEYKQILFALQELKCTLDKNSTEYQRLLKVEECAKKRDSGEMRSAAMEFAKQFSSAALANMFSGSVLHLLLGI